MVRRVYPPDQHVLSETDARRVMGLDTAYQVDAINRDFDVLVIASHCGVVPARVVCAHPPRAVVMVDCGIGLQGSGIAGLHYFEGAGVPAAAAAVETVCLGDARDMYATGVIAWANALATGISVLPGIPVRDAAELLLRRDPASGASAAQKAQRAVVHRATTGTEVVCVDSIAFAEPSDAARVVCIGGHAGPAAYEYVLRLRPHAVISTDGGIGKDRSGLVALDLARGDGIPWAAVGVATARLGDGFSTWRDGVIAHLNEPAAATGVRIGMSASVAAALMAGS